MRAAGGGGALLAPETLESQNRVLIGSTTIFHVGSIEVARKYVENDVYWIHRVVSATASALKKLYRPYTHILVGQGEARYPALFTRSQTSMDDGM